MLIVRRAAARDREHPTAPTSVTPVAIGARRHANDESKHRDAIGPCSYRSASIGSSRDAFSAGSKPLTRPTNIRIAEVIPTSCSESTRWIRDCDETVTPEVQPADKISA